MLLQVGAEPGARLRAAPGRRHRGGDRHGRGAVDRRELGAHGRQRQRARGEGAADQRPPALAASTCRRRAPLNSGTGTFSDIRFSGRAVQQNIIRFDGVEGSAIIDASPGNLNGEMPRPSGCSRASRTCRSSASTRTTIPAEYGTRHGRPDHGRHQVRQQRVPRLRSSSTSVTTRFDRRTPSTRGGRQAAEVDAAPAPVRRLGRRPARQGPARSSSAATRATGSTPGINFVEAVPSAAARARAVPAVAAAASTPSAARGAIILPGASANPDFDIVQLQDVAKFDEDSFSARIDVQSQRQQSTSTRATSATTGTNDQPEGVTGRRALDRGAGRATRWSRCRAPLAVGASTSSRSATTGADRGQRPRPDRERHRPLDITLNITRQRGQHRHRRPGLGLRRGHPGRPAPPEQRHQRPRRALRAVLALLHRQSELARAAATASRSAASSALIRMETDRLGGTTYTFSNLNDFLANRLQQVAVPGRPLRAEPVQRRRDRAAAHAQQSTTSATRRTSGRSHQQLHR